MGSRQDMLTIWDFDVSSVLLVCDSLDTPGHWIGLKEDSRIKARRVQEALATLAAEMPLAIEKARLWTEKNSTKS